MDQLNDLQKNYQSLLENGSLSDVTVVVGGGGIDGDGKEFHLHKVVLGARSPVFLAMFSKDCVESQQNHVKLDDITVDVFEALLQYLYYGVMPDLASQAIKLFVAADKVSWLEKNDLMTNTFQFVVSTGGVEESLPQYHYIQVEGTKCNRGSPFRRYAQ